jgi:hypothetical protein
MVDVPFVSESFQRAYRNRFPSQTSSGRDLHVSDVVIPVVDFTPSASGTSLPESLRFCRNLNTINTYSSGTTGFVDIVTTPGFWGIDIQIGVADAGGDVSIFLYDGVTRTNINSLAFVNVSGTAQLFKDQMITYVPAGYTGQWQVTLDTGSTLEAYVYNTPLADVNGTLLDPYGYDPQ